jgi:hypothetical protein
MGGKKKMELVSDRNGNGMRRSGRVAAVIALAVLVFLLGGLGLFRRSQNDAASDALGERLSRPRRGLYETLFAEADLVRELNYLTRVANREMPPERLSCIRSEQLFRRRWLAATRRGPAKSQLTPRLRCG